MGGGLGAMRKGYMPMVSVLYDDLMMIFSLVVSVKVSDTIVIDIQD